MYDSICLDDAIK